MILTLETGNLDFGYKLVRLSTTDQEGISEFPMPHVVVFFVFNGLRREREVVVHFVDLLV
jgi:hypothetical protein